MIYQMNSYKVFYRADKRTEDHVTFGDLFYVSFNQKSRNETLFPLMLIEGRV